MTRVTGSVITVQRKDGPILFIKARDRTGRQIKKRLGPEADWSRRTRETALREFLVDLGRTPDAPDDEITVGDAARAWLRYVEHEKARAASTVRDYTNCVNNSIVPHFGKDKPLSSIERDDIDEFRLVLLERVSRRTAQKTLVLLYGMLKFAKRRRWILENPADDAERVTLRRRTEFAVLNPTEVLAVARCATEEGDGALFTVAAFTGLRQGELRSLRWRDVDFVNRLVHVRRSTWRGTEDTPKSGKARSVPLIDQAGQALALLSQRPHFTGPDDYVFATVKGTALDDTGMRERLYDAMDKAGVSRDRGTGKPFVFHDLRHTFGTLAVQAFPLSDVKAFMGHADIQTTMVYVHHTPQHDAADRLGAVVDKASGYQAGTELIESDMPEST
jgi:integrase